MPIIQSILGNFFPRAFITLVLAALGLWMFHYNLLQRPIAYEDYNYSTAEADRLKAYPSAQYRHGLHAWFQNDHKTAANFFRRAVIQDVLFLDAWHRFAEVEAAAGREQFAKDILGFTTGLTKNVYRWKWQQMLLARELGEQEIFFQNTNYLLSHDVLQHDALQLLHNHFGGDSEAAAAVLEPDHWDSYLSWMMRWGMTDKTLKLWQRLIETGAPNAEIALQYAHFLLQKKRIVESRAIWCNYMGDDSITNPGFEAEITRKGFDWRIWNERTENWEINRVNDHNYEGDYSLKIDFKGRENISFHHLYQIIAADPFDQFRLSYAWKSQKITTDQGLFIEVYSYDKKGLYKAAPIMVGSNDWQQGYIEFALPEDSRAAVVRIRRRPSDRFDNKISGTVWLDDFRLERVSPKIADNVSGE
jgi:hypothetical protein